MTSSSASSWQAIALVQSPTPTTDDPGGRGEDFGKSSPVGLVVILLFLVAVAFLVRSMNKHLRRVPSSFDEPDTAKPTDTTDGTDALEREPTERDSGGDRPDRS